MSSGEGNTTKGRRYERQVFDQKRMTRPDLEFLHDIKLLDTAGQRRRQVDVHNVDDGEIVECKCFTDPVDVGVIDSLIGMRDDLGAATARIVSASGFTEGAKKRAKKAGIVCQTLKYTDAESRRIEAEWYSPDAPDGAYRGDCLDSDYDTSRSLGRVVFDNRDPLDIEFPLFVSWHLHWGDPVFNRAAAIAVLSHQLQDSPDNELVREFVAGFCGDWEDGQEWELPAAHVRAWLSEREL